MIPGTLLREVRALHKKGAPLNLTAMKRRQPDLLQRVYELKPFVGWKNTLAAAGIEYDQIKVELLDYLHCPICGKELRILGWHAHVVHEASWDDILAEYPGQESTCEEIRAKMSRMESDILPHWEPLWTPEYILDRLYAFYELGLPLHKSGIENLLYQHANDHFGNIRAAFAKIGLNYDDISMRPNQGKFENPADVIAEVKRRHSQGLPLSPQELCQGENINPTLLRRGRIFFGTWHNTLREAGLDPNQIMGHHTGIYTDPEEILQTIRDHFANGGEIYPAAIIQNIEKGNMLYYHACEHFGTWQETVAAAGIDTSHAMKLVMRKNFSSKALVLKELLERQRKNLSVTYRDVSQEGPEGKDLIQKATRFYGSWPAAVKVAFSLSQPKKHARNRFPNKKSLLKVLWERHQQGLPLNSTSLFQKPFADRSLYKHSIKFFGTWQKALNKAGIRDKTEVSGRGLRFPDADSVIAALQDRAGRGLPISQKSIESKGPEPDPTLALCARRHIGGWAKVLKAAGFNPQEHLLHDRYPEPQDIIDAINKRHREGLPLNVASLMQQPFPDFALYKRAIASFNSWSAAIQAAGLDPDNDARPQNLRFPNAAAVIAAIHERVRRGLPLNVSALAITSSHSDGWLIQSGKKYFGSWNGALTAAGLDPEKHTKLKRSIYHKPELVVKEIRRRKAKGLPLSSQTLTQKGPHRDIPLYKKSCNFFGSWTEALKQAGVSR